MNNRIVNLLGILVLLLTSISCGKDEAEAEDNVSTADIASIKEIVITGDWQVFYYFDLDEDQAIDYEDFTFKFNADGTLVTTDGNTALSGAWQIKSATENDESTAVNFKIYFSSPALFQKLSNDWLVKNYTDTKIELTHTGTSEEGTTLLTFQK